MLGGQAKPFPVQLLVNYWEMRPARIGARLDELLRSGVSHLATFVPWQAVESDISHTLTRFLQSAADRKMSVSLILTPEVGVHFANSGLPKTLIDKPEFLARHSKNGQVGIPLPPNAFALPSLISQEFQKRYHNFLSRMDNLLSDLARSHPKLLENVTAVLTGSFWKYYRAPLASADSAFSGVAGDFSGATTVAYRQRLETFFAQREFSDPNFSSANRWKTRAHDELNRKWFNQHCEDVFRARSNQFIRRKAAQISLSQVELFTPEADPGFAYSNFLQLVSGARPDFAKLSALIDDAATRLTFVSESTAPSLIHWTGLGGFQGLTDSEKQFLLLKSLLLLGGRGGGILLDEAEWFRLSASFRARAESLAKSLHTGELKQQPQALYLSSHLWSSGGALWEELLAQLGYGANLVASPEAIQFAGPETQLAVVDPNYILTRETVQKLIAWSQKEGRVLALPRSSFYTDAARVELEKAASTAAPLDIDLGVSYRVRSLGGGKLVVYDPPSSSESKSHEVSVWRTFLSSILSVAGVSTPCSTSDGRLQVIPLKTKSGATGLFVLNGTHRVVTADLMFSQEMGVSDLSAVLNAEPGRSVEVIPATRFSLEVPSSGVLPLAISELVTRVVEATPRPEVQAEETTSWN